MKVKLMKMKVFRNAERKEKNETENEKKKELLNHSFHS